MKVGPLSPFVWSFFVKSMNKYDLVLLILHFRYPELHAFVKECFAMKFILSQVQLRRVIHILVSGFGMMNFGL